MNGASLDNIAAHLATDGWEEGVVYVDSLWREYDGVEDQDSIRGPAGHLHQEQEARHLGHGTLVLCEDQ